MSGKILTRKPLSVIFEWTQNIKAEQMDLMKKAVNPQCWNFDNLLFCCQTNVWSSMWAFWPSSQIQRKVFTSRQRKASLTYSKARFRGMFLQLLNFKVKDKMSHDSNPILAHSIKCNQKLQFPKLHFSIINLDNAQLMSVLSVSIRTTTFSEHWHGSMKDFLCFDPMY